MNTLKYKMYNNQESCTFGGIMKSTINRETHKPKQTLISRLLYINYYQWRLPRVTRDQ